ncbi:MAG: HDOD domain-containing protein [Betaproteobacteria bacterium]
MEKSAFDELKTTGKLPSPSGVALQIIDLTRKDDVSVSELAHVVQADPALSGRLIKFANSAMAGPRRPIVAVSDAIRLLGIGTVRQLALGFSILGHHRAGTCKSFDYHAFWSRSLASAITANALCLRTRTAAPDEAFTCGLLARIGSLALATLHPDGFAELLDRQGEPGGTAIVPLEREMFRTDHNELCAALLDEWMLPRIFVSTVFHQEDPAQGNWPDGSRELTLCNILHLSVRLGDYCVANDAVRATMAADLIFDAARVGIDSDALALVTDQVVVEWREWGRILEVKTADLPPFSSLAKAAAQAKAAGVALAPPVPDAKADDGAAAIENKLGLRARLEPLRILVVDDDPAILALLQHLLAQDGHTVVAARNGREALRQAMVDRPQMIVCDWMMPEMDGLSLCRALRDSEEGRQIYFLLLTGLEREDNLIEAFEAGVDDFVTKPFAPKVLMARLRAGHRVIRLQEEAVRDSQSLRRFATELAVANRRLRQAALTDPLTGLPNRRYAMERLEQEWTASNRNQRSLVLMMVDVDRFKVVNDTYGHDVGDQLLRHIALSLRKAARGEDVICRLGGEEFLVICPDTAMLAAMRLAERLRLAVGGSPAVLGAIHYPVKISIGVAEREPAMVKFDELLKAADQVLYHAKHRGGDQVQSASPPGRSSAGGPATK